MYQFNAYEMSYSNVNGKEQRYEKDIEVKDGKGKVRTVANGKEKVHELTPMEIKQLLGFEPKCEGKLASGEPCPHKGHYLVEPAKTSVARSKKHEQKTKSAGKEKQKGGFYCGYHK